MSANLGREVLLHQAVRTGYRWQELARRLGSFLLFLLCAVAVFVLGSNYYTIFPTNKNLYYEGGVTAFFLIAAVILRRQPRLSVYWPIAYAFFVAAAVTLVTSLTVGWRDALFAKIGIIARTNQEAAFGKVFEAVITITTILLLSRLAGMRPSSLYIQRGNLKWGLLIGLGTLLNFSSSSLMFFASRYSDIEKLGSAILMGLIFSLANGFMEELWLRGLFLRKLTPVLGSTTTIVLTGLWFALFHLGSVYMQPAARLVFLINLATFGVAWGVIMHKTDSWIAPGLMHAASDFFLFIALLSNT